MEWPLTPLEFARRARRLYPRRLAVIEGGQRWTYAEFFARCDCWSARLQALGVRAGDRVAYIAPNVHGLLEAFYAVPQIGAVLVPINYRLTAEDFAWLIGHSGATVVCCHADYLPAVEAQRAQLGGVRHFVALTGSQDGWLDYEAELAGADSRFEPATISESQLLTINYTSGTTSRPKGVMITHRNAALNVLGTLVHFPLHAADRYLWTLPMFHANGWTFVWIVTAVGACHVCLPKVDPASVFAQVREHGVSVLCAAPTVLIGIANAPVETRAELPRGLRVMTAGAPPAASTIERVEEQLGWTITQIYGLTETSPLMTVCEARPDDASLALAERCRIKARQGVETLTSGEVRVVDSEGLEVPHDGQTLGEITVRGNVVMAGYFEDPAASEQALRGGWFHSGDAAVVHPDGYVEIRDRFKDVIISGGENISSIEVESALMRHPAVQEVAIVGLPHPRWGESPHAFVVLRAGTSSNEAELINFARDHLAHFKAPTAVSFVPELPKTATGKIQKYVLRGRKAAIAAQ